MNNVVAWPTPQQDAVTRNVNFKLSHGNYGSQRCIAAGAWLAVADQFLPKERTNSIRADECWTRKCSSVYCGNCYAVVFVHEVADHSIGHKFDGITASAGVEKYVMQINSVNDDVGVLESRPQRCPCRYSH